MTVQKQLSLYKFTNFHNTTSLPIILPEVSNQLISLDHNITIYNLVHNQQHQNEHQNEWSAMGILNLILGKHTYVSPSQVTFL